MTYNQSQFNILMMLLITRRIVNLFSKWSKPKPKDRSREFQRSYAVGDEKAAKLSKSEQQQQNKVKAIQAQKIQKQTERKTLFMKTHSTELEQYKTKDELQNIKYYQYLYLTGNVRKKPTKTKKDIIQDKLAENFQFLPIQQPTFNPNTNKFKNFTPTYGNYTKQINARLPKLQEFDGDEAMRRMGTLGTKLGMTTLFDKWGDMVPVTIILLDRVQVVQIKAPEPGNQFYQVQMGIGQKRIKKTIKPELGHFLKAKVPPKKHLAEFPVSKQCLLPVGYMMSARHYTPGMFVDVSGKTVGHGFSGTIKRYGFSRQPATHGNSLTTRVLGSTGGRQDPGRVFKQKKMYGRMGGKVSVQRGMAVFKIDVDKNILYLKGSLPGKAGTILKISDTLLADKCELNLKISHFPTFVQEPGLKYARQFSMYCGERDPQQIEIHDNAYIIDDGEQEQKEDVPKDKDLQQ